MAAKSKIIKQVRNLYLWRDKTGTFGSTTLTAAAAAGATTLTVAGITNFGVSDWIRVGAGEETEVVQLHASTAPTGSTITLATALRKAHVSGEVVIEQQPYDLGPSTDQGVTIRYSGEASDVFVDDARLVHTVLNGFVDAEALFTFPNVSLYSFAAAVGALLAKVSGSGTQASPLQLISDGSEFAGDSSMTLGVVGTLFDNTEIMAWLFGIDADYTGIRLALSRGQLAGLPAHVVAAGGGAFDTTLPTITADTTNKPTKGKVFDALAEAGFFEDAGSGGNSTVSSGGAAGASTVVVASGTGFAAGDWVRFGTGNTMQIFQLESVVTNTLTIRGTFYRSLTSGDAAREQLLTLVAVSEEGAELQLGGSIDKFRIAQIRTTVGIRPGNADAAFRFGIVETSLAHLARALGIPQSAVSGGRLAVTGTNLASSTEINGVYLRGTLVDATSWVAMGWGTAIDLRTAMELLFNNRGAPSRIPFTAKPTAGLALLNYT